MTASKWQLFAAEMRSDRAWRVVVSSGIGFAFGVSILPLYTIGAFVEPISQSLGWSRGEVQASLILIVLATLVGAWPTGWLVDRFGVRRVAITSQICLAAGLAMLAMSPANLLAFYAIWFAMSLAALGTTPITWTRALVGWFDRARGAALAISLCGSGVAAILFPPVTVWLIAEAGWRSAYLILAGAVLLIALPVTIWLMPRSSVRVGRAGDGAPAEEAPPGGFELGTALRGHRFWLLFASTLLLGFALTGMIANLVPMLTDRGMPAETAARYMGVFGTALIVGRLTAGVALDRVWAPLVGAILFPLAAISCAVLASGTGHHGILIVAVFFFGLASGAEVDMIPFLVTRYFGLLRYSQLYGLQWTAWTLASGVAPAVYGYAFDRSGNYMTILYIASLCFLIAPVLICLLGRYPQFTGQAVLTLPEGGAKARVPS